MSQIEQGLRTLLAHRPEIERCVRAGLVNRRALARQLIELGWATPDQFDAVVATVRRYDFGRDAAPDADLFPQIRVSLKDRILILDFERDRSILGRLERVIAQIDFDRGETLKIVVGSQSIKLFLDARKEAALRPLLERVHPIHRWDHLSEISMVFPESATTTRNVLAVIARELSLNGIVITELLTASPELLVYVREDQAARAYEVVRGLQAPNRTPTPSRRGASVARSLSRPQR